MNLTMMRQATKPLKKKLKKKSNKRYDVMEWLDLRTIRTEIVVLQITGGEPSYYPGYEFWNDVAGF